MAAALAEAFALDPETLPAAIREKAEILNGVHSNAAGIVRYLRQRAAGTRRMTTAARPRDRLIAAVVLSAVIGLVGGGLAAWGIYARFGPVERVTQQTSSAARATAAAAR